MDTWNSVDTRGASRPGRSHDAAHLEQLAKELSELCDKIDYDEQVDFQGFNVPELRDMLGNPLAFELAVDYNAGQEERGAFMESRADELEAKI